MVLKSLRTSISHLFYFRMQSPASISTQKPCHPKKRTTKQGLAKEQRSWRQLHNHQTAGSGVKAETRPPSDSLTPVNGHETCPL